VNWWFCLKHNRVESDKEVDSRGDDRVGPYPSEERAANWRAEFQERNERAEREDREWEDGNG
jgi:hypothetical protein